MSGLYRLGDPGAANEEDCMSTDPAIMMAEIMGGLTGPGGAFELIEAPGRPVPGFVGAARNLGEVLTASVGFGERDYIVTADAAERLTYARHAERVAALAEALREEHSVRPGDRVAINAANTPDWIVSFWAVTAVGAVAVGYNAWWAPLEIEYALGHTEPVLVIADAKRAALIGDRAAVLTLEEGVPAAVERHRGAELRVHDADPEDPAVILYTSGTSGRPKGAVHSHRNLASVIEYHRLNDAMIVEMAAKWGIESRPEDRRYLLALPLFHIASLHNLAVPRLATGSTVVMYQGGFDVDRALSLVEKEKVTNWGAVPTMAHRILEHGDVSKYDLSSLTAFALASAPSSPAFKARLSEAFPPARGALVDSYGLTESCTAIAVASPMDLEQAPGTLGRPVTGVRLEIRDAEGRTLPEGEEGEVCVLSPYVMLGYWNDEQATSSAIGPDGWLRTGDIGMIDQGRLRLTTRRSDLIIRGGENVYPVEIENVLAEYPGVHECVVLGAPHPDLGQEVMAVVVFSGEPASEKELADFARERLAYFKIPSRWEITTSPLPRNATGKVIRREVENAVGLSPSAG